SKKTIGENLHQVHLIDMIGQAVRKIISSVQLSQPVEEGIKSPFKKSQNFRVSNFIPPDRRRFPGRTINRVVRILCWNGFTRKVVFSIEMDFNRLRWVSKHGGNDLD